MMRRDPWGLLARCVGGGILLLGGPEGGDCAELSEGKEVVVVYNRNLPASLAVAEHYAAKREVPRRQLIGLDLPKEETLSRSAFTRQLEVPLKQRFRDEKWFEYDYQVVPATRERVGSVVRTVKKSTVRYMALCYGVPLRIASDPEFDEEGSEKIRIELRRNEAAVDSELAVLPIDPNQRPIYGPLTNPFFGATNSFMMKPETGVLMVTRLDGPTPETAKRLVDLAMQAEEDGLWGRAYFDLRGLTSGEYKIGDDWIARAAEFSRQVGIETHVDTEPETIPSTLPISHIGLYAGWYTSHVAGPFRAPRVEFMPGAIAYHLHSFSAETIRSPSLHWVGPLLDRGATATMGCVYEPYLALTPNLEVFFSRIFLGFGFAEAAYASQQAVSWQTTVVGDPLYRPFSKPLNLLATELAAKKSPLSQWLGMMNVNRALVGNRPVGEVVRLMAQDAGVQLSAILSEKLADLYRQDGKVDESEAAYRRALRLNPSPNQALRIRLRLVALLADQDQPEGVEAVLDLVDRHPAYSGLGPLLQDALGMAKRLGDQDLGARVQMARNSRGGAKPLDP